MWVSLVFGSEKWYKLFNLRDFFDITNLHLTKILSFTLSILPDQP